MLETGHYEAERPEASIAVMPWGGSKAAAYTAYQRLAGAGQDLGWYYTMFLNPLPPGLVDELKRKDLVLVPELNYLGQFSSVLRSQGVNAQSITQYTGLPFKISDLETRNPGTDRGAARGASRRYEQAQPGLRLQMVPRLRRLWRQGRRRAGAGAALRRALRADRADP